MPDADPAGAVLVLLAQAIPVELHHDPAVLVGMDLLARGADDHRRLRATHHRLGRDAGRAELLLAGNRGEAAAELMLVAGTGRILVRRRLDAGGGDEVLAVLIGPR